MLICDSPRPKFRLEQLTIFADPINFVFRFKNAFALSLKTTFRPTINPFDKSLEKPEIDNFSAF